VLLLDGGDWRGEFQMPRFGACFLPLAGRGGEERRSFSSMYCGSRSCWSGADAASPAGNISAAVAPSTSLAEGQLLAFPGSSPSTALDAIQLPNFMADGQPLPPWSLLRGRQVIYLQAWMPMRRFSGVKMVYSRCSTPSGLVPGGEADDHAWLRLRRGGDGATRSLVLDCFFFFRFRGFSIIYMGLVVMFLSLEVLLVRCTPSTSF
jgi:hypothetical protein